jgi:hypothetical protein
VPRLPEPGKYLKRLALKSQWKVDQEIQPEFFEQFRTDSDTSGQIDQAYYLAARKSLMGEPTI